MHARPVGELLSAVAYLNPRATRPVKTNPKTTMALNVAKFP